MNHATTNPAGPDNRTPLHIEASEHEVRSRPGDAVTFRGDVLVVPGLVPADLCARAIELAEGDGGWQKSRTVREANQAQTAGASARQSDSLFITGRPGFSEVDEALHRCFMTAHATLEARSGQELMLMRDEGHTLMRYRPGGFYRLHHDYMGCARPPIVRALTGLIFLNHDFAGGRLRFPRQDLEITPSCGSVVLFPSIWTHPHCATEVTFGDRYCVVTWWA